jgi:hypothetical protein
MPFPPSSTIPFRPHLLKHVLPNTQRRATTSRSISLQSFRPALSASTSLDQSRNATYKARGTGSQFPLRVGSRGFKTTTKRELPFATLAFSTFGVLKVRHLTVPCSCISSRITDHPDPPLPTVLCSSGGHSSRFSNSPHPPPIRSGQSGPPTCQEEMARDAFRSTEHSTPYRSVLL